jgi:hypothetical protein
MTEKEKKILDALINETEIKEVESSENELVIELNGDRNKRVVRILKLKKEKNESKS